jgi:hypothetical protein
MNPQQKALQEIGKNVASLSAKQGLVGLDGFVDKIVHPVDQRSGSGDRYTPIETITDFARRIGSAAGKSANIELASVVDKLGGNGPILAHAQLSLGLKMRYIGALGDPLVDPVFESFAKQTQAVSIANPGVTHAAEFSDGKIMFGSMSGLDEVTYERLIERIGEGAFFDLMSRMDLISLVNWTMIPHMTDFFNALLDKVLPQLPPHDNRMFFFDLADPEKRSRADVANVLRVISRFQSYGHVVLGLNWREAQQIDAVLGQTPFDEATEDNLCRMATRIRNELKIGTVVIHPVDGAACATRDEAVYVRGPLCAKPKITTGAGDHFNAGFTTARLIGMSPEASLTVAVATSGLYVRTARSPSVGDIERFLDTDWNPTTVA